MVSSKPHNDSGRNRPQFPDEVTEVQSGSLQQGATHCTTWPPILGRLYLLMPLDCKLQQVEDQPLASLSSLVTAQYMQGAGKRAEMDQSYVLQLPMASLCVPGHRAVMLFCNIQVILV